ncbi:hypothetical protein BJ878DRAFT_500985 [Calycina marina]|uniref:Uncharacterized protein n=1 Tax=Calycina marina TaxID=1763456 RepID=A0A9P7Z5B8_9HELO|nr:hypothetical protein BJ878DRAFT_500985 [Calycina marina]
MDFNTSKSESYAARVESYAGFGNGLAATQDLKEGDVIIRVNNPFLILVEKAALELVCSQCFYEKHGLKRCSGCKVVWYCSASCQSTAWKASGHKLECPIYQRLPDVLPTEVRGLVNLLLCKEIGTKPDPKWASLEGHVASLRKQKEWNNIVLQANAAIKYSGSVDTYIETVVELLCRMATNAFRVTLPDSTETGLCFEPLVSLANHSCDPNAIVMFDGRKMFLRALKFIDEGDQIFISYVDTTSPRDVRQAEIQASYFFTCKCERCTNNSGFAPVVNSKPSPRLDLLLDRGNSIAQYPDPKETKVRNALSHYRSKDDPSPTLVVLLYILLTSPYVQPHHPVRVSTLYQIYRQICILATHPEGDEKLLAGAEHVPKKLLMDIDYISASQCILILLIELAPKSHGANSQFLRNLSRDLSAIVELQEPRGEVGEKLQEWAMDASAEGKMYSNHIFAQFRELAAYAFKLIEDVSGV